MKMSASTRWFHWFVLLLAVIAVPQMSWAATCADGELCPGRIWNPAALQIEQQILYVPSQDAYLLTTSDYDGVNGRALGHFMDPEGVLFGGPITLSPNLGISHTATAYNPDRDEIFLVHRSINQTVTGVFLSSTGVAISAPFVLGAGDTPNIAYSPAAQNYIVTFSRRIQGLFWTFYFIVDGDSTNPNHIETAGTIDSNGLSDVVVYGPSTEQFLVVYVKDLNPPQAADIYGRFVSGTGALGSPFPIEVSRDNQQQPSLAASQNTFMLIYEDWEFAAGFRAGVTGIVLNANGGKINEFSLAQTTEWDAPGPITYNTATDTFIASWRTAFSEAWIEQRAREFDPATGAAMGLDHLLSSLNAPVLAAASRPEIADPQATFVWRRVLGSDGVHVGIIDLPAPPPVIQPPMPQAFIGVQYDGEVPVAGGKPPLAYEIVSGIGNLPAGLAPRADFATSGVITGVPTILGTSGVIRVKVTDADARTDEEDLTINIGLAAPTPIDPSSGTNQTQPQFSWGSSPTAATYNLVVESVTDGGIVVNEPAIAHTAGTTFFTPAYVFEDAKVYKWKVKANNGAGTESVFSAYKTFDVDTSSPQVSTLTVFPPAAFGAVAAPAIASSGDFDSVNYDKTKATDGNNATLWSTPGRPVLTTEHIILDAGPGLQLSRVRLRSIAGSGSTFPVDFKIQVSTDNVTYSDVATVSNFTAAAGTEYSHAFPPISARYVKILVTKVNAYSDGKFYTQIAEIGVDTASLTPNQLSINWLAPGDNGGTGTASSYDLRWSFNNIVTDLDFMNATLVPNLPTPQPAGAQETVNFSGLLQETNYYFALKSMDDAGNPSPMSNVPVGTTAGVAPGQITTLAASMPELDSIRLDWVASGDDGDVGTAFAYVLRYSTSPITEENFGSATQVLSGVPSPAVATTPQFAVVTGLTSTTDYYFAIRVFDDVGNTSLISNVVMASTLDDTPPAAITDLSGTSGAFQPALLAMTATASSGDAAPAFGKEMATDNNGATSWSSPPRPTMQQEFLTIDAGPGPLKMLNQVRIQARDVSDLFPEDYLIQLSTDGVVFNTILSLTGISVAPGQWIDHPFAPTPARYVRLLVTKSRQYLGGDFWVQLAELQAYEAQVLNDAVTLQWTAPGNNGNEGTASEYDLRWSPTQINNDGEFNAVLANRVAISAPQSASLPETIVVSSLTPETRYYFAVKTADGVPNWSGLSTPAPFVDTPGTPPGAVTTLSLGGATGTSLTLNWNATGDDGTTGTASSYDMRYSTSPIDASNFDSAMQATGEPTPKPNFGDPETMMVNGLDNQTMYYFAVKVGDELDNFSSISNVLSASTLDEIDPAPVNNLAAAAGGFTYSPLPVTAVASSGDIAASFSKEKAVDSNMSTSWSSPGRAVAQEEFLKVDAGAVGAPFTIGRITVCSRDVANLFPVDFEIQVSTDDAIYNVVASETGFVSVPGTCYPYQFNPVPGRYVRLRITKSPQYTDLNYYSQVAELTVETAVSSVDEVTLTWNATGDDGMTGTAAKYDIRYAMSDIATETDWTNATQVPPGQIPAPKAPTMPESFVVSGLSGETEYYFAIRVLDEADNDSDTSNVPSAFTAAVPPAAITDLNVIATAETSITLEWSVTGDDGMVGIADSYDMRYSLNPIDADNFNAAMQVPSMPAPIAPPNTQSKMVTGLTKDTDYYFAIKAKDEAGGISFISNVVATETDDLEKPEKITNLSAAVSQLLQPVVETAIDSSGDLVAAWDKDKAVDNMPATAWSTPGRAVAQPEFLTLSLPGPTNVARFELCARDVTGDLFPEDFHLELSNDNIIYNSVVFQAGFVATAGTCYTFDIAPQMASFVKLRITKTRLYNITNTYYAQLAELKVSEQVTVPDKITLTWKAPGDNGAAGTAASYDIRYSTSDIVTELDFTNATAAPGIPAPSAGGTDETFVVNGLNPSTLYYFAIKTTDDDGLTSDTSNVASETTGSP